jgi:hypothetical protein
MYLYSYFAFAFRLTEQLAKRPSIDDISAELEVLKTEHASLKKFLKDSSEKETKEKRELEEKHAKAMSELAEKLKSSNQRIKTLVSNTKAYEAEAANIEKMIFRKDFTFFRLLHCIHPVPSRKTDHVIFYMKHRVSDSNGRRNLPSPRLKHMKKRGIPLMTSLRLAMASPSLCI